MTTIPTTNDKNVAMGIHLLTFSSWIFPFGNFIFPLVLWLTHKTKSKFVDSHGCAVLNFQISTFLYAFFIITMGLIIGFSLGFINLASIERISEYRGTLDDSTFNAISSIVILAIICIFLLITIGIINFICTIQGAVRASNGDHYTYPLTIPFLRVSPENQTPEV